MTNKIRYFIANWKMYGDLRSLKTLNKVIKFTRSNIIKTKLSRDNVAYFITNTNKKEEKILELVNQIKSSSFVYVRTWRVIIVCRFRAHKNKMCINFFF